MTLALGTVPAGTTIYIPFASYGKTNGESITLTGLAVTDIEVYKNGSVTQRASDAGYALLDTDGIDFDAITGIHGFSIDLSDNTDAGFYAVGSWYWVVVSAVTVDSQTVNFIAAVFRIGPAESVAGYPKADVSHFGGTAGTFAAGRPEVNTTHAAGTAWGSGAITAASIAADAITDAKVASDVTIASVTGAVGSVTGAVTVGANNDKTGYSLSAAGVQAVWDALTSALTTASSIGKLLVDNVNATISSRSTVTTAQVNAEVVDALATDTYAEPGQGAPAATATLAAKINYLYKAWRNKKEQTATTLSLYDDAGTTVDQKAAVSDDGTTTTVGEVATGP